MTDHLRDDQFDRQLRDYLAWQSQELYDPPTAIDVATRISARVGSRSVGLRLTPQLVWVLLALLIAALVGTVIVGANLLRNGDLPPSGAGNGWIAVSANPKTIYSGAYGDIYLVGPGARARRIIGSDGDGLAQACPRFSPDGTRLAYGEGRASPQPDDRPLRGRASVADRAVTVVTLSDDGDLSSTITHLTAGAGPGPILCPEWSPTGKHLAFRAGPELWIVDTASAETRIVPITLEDRWEQNDLEWSRDGSLIAVSEPGRIRVVRVTDGASNLIAVQGDTPASLGWTVGDDRIIYVGNDLPGHLLAVRVVGVDGLNNTQLTPEGTANLEIGSRDAVVSPDGTRVAFVRLTNVCVADGCGSDSIRIVTMDTDGSNVTEVATPPDFGAEGLEWSPDGERLLFGSGGGGVISVAVIPGFPAIVLVNGELNLEGSAGELTWQPVPR